MARILKCFLPTPGCSVTGEMTAIDSVKQLETADIRDKISCSTVKLLRSK